jgi:hypothetical protein
MRKFYEIKYRQWKLFSSKIYKWIQQTCHFTLCKEYHWALTIHSYAFYFLSKWKEILYKRILSFEINARRKNALDVYYFVYTFSFFNVTKYRFAHLSCSKKETYSFYHCVNRTTKFLNWIFSTIWETNVNHNE